MRIAAVVKGLAEAYNKAFNAKAVNILHASGKEASKASSTFTYTWYAAVSMTNHS